MSLLSIPNTFSAGAVIIASQHNANFSTIYSDYNGNIQNVNIASGAGIVYSKLTLTGGILDADIASSAAISYSKLNLASSIKVSDLSFSIFTSGMIMLWSGTIATIPSGWVLCNGSNSTPDLRNRFVVCADADVAGVAKSTVTGSAAQSGNGQLLSTTITTTTNSATLVGLKGSGGISQAQGLIAESTTGMNGQTLTGLSFGTGSANVAVYYALAYIMKT